ncbi:hypothetical protein ACP70R_044358 [Stipagrostis hirtigluma subsp. patula]
MDGNQGWCHINDSGSNNWDLDAVVRLGCGGGRVGPPPPPPSYDPFAAAHLPPPFPPQPQLDELPDAVEWQLLADLPLMQDPAPIAVEDLCHAFFAAPPPPQASSPPRNYEPAPPILLAGDKPEAPGGGGGSSRSKKTSRSNKNQQVIKKVTRVLADSPVADRWAWRKYGQKVIKGSPYQRGYYRCSTDTDCRARKQVERCRTDPTALIVTYTGEHNHRPPLTRNSLAGSTRSKPVPLPPPPPQVMLTPRNAAEEVEPPQELAAPPASGQSPYAEFEDEQDDDAVAVRVLLEDTEMATEDALVFPKLQADEPVAPGNGGGADDNMLFPLPDEPAASYSWRNVGDAGMTTGTVVNGVKETFSVSDWEAAAAATGWGWGW